MSEEETKSIGTMIVLTFIFGIMPEIVCFITGWKLPNIIHSIAIGWCLMCIYTYVRGIIMGFRQAKAADKKP